VVIGMAFLFGENRDRQGFDISQDILLDRWILTVETIASPGAAPPNEVAIDWLLAGPH